MPLLFQNKTWNSGELTAAICGLCFDLIGGDWQDPTSALGTFSLTVGLNQHGSEDLGHSFLLDGNRIKWVDENFVNDSTGVDEIGVESGFLAPSPYVVWPAWAESNFPLYDYDHSFTFPNHTMTAKRAGKANDHEFIFDQVPDTVLNVVTYTRGTDIQIRDPYKVKLILYKNNERYTTSVLSPFIDVDKSTGLQTIKIETDLSHVTRTMFNPRLTSTPTITGNPIGTAILFQDAAAFVRIVVKEEYTGSNIPEEEDPISPTPMIGAKCYQGGADMSFFDDETNLVPLVDRPSFEIPYCPNYPVIIPYYFDPSASYSVDVAGNTYAATIASTNPEVGYFHVNDDLTTLQPNQFASFSVSKNGGGSQQMAIRRMSESDCCFMQLFVFLNSKGAFEMFWARSAYQGQFTYERSDFVKCAPCDVGVNKRSTYRTVMDNTVRIFSEKLLANRDNYKFIRTFLQSPVTYKANIEDNTWDRVQLFSEQIVFRSNKTKFFVPFSYKTIDKNVQLPAN